MAMEETADAVVDNPEVVEFFDKATRVMEEEMAIQIKEVSPAQNVFTVMKTTPLLNVETCVTKPIRKQSCLDLQFLSQDLSVPGAWSLVTLQADVIVKQKSTSVPAETSLSVFISAAKLMIASQEKIGQQRCHLRPP